MALTTVCAWCSSQIGPGTAEPAATHADTPVSHGLCDDCADQLLNPEKWTLQGFLDNIETPVFLVDGDGRVITANALAQAAVRKDLSGIEDKLGGEVFECAHARLPGGCGNTTHCAACTIRNTVLDTHADGLSRHNVEAFQDLITEGGSSRVRVLITTMKAGNTVLLRIEDMRAGEPRPANAA